MRIVRVAVTVLVAALLAAVACETARGASQMFPSKREARGLSAYLVKPTEGTEKTPDGWTLITSRSFGNSALADECLGAAKSGATCRTTSYRLPRSDYFVSVLVRGKGKVRLAGTEAWTDFQTPRGNYYAWVEVGKTTGATTVGVEVQVTGGNRSLYYGGLLAEGGAMPVVPVAKVLQKIRAGKPATVVLLGDSVTENSGGTGGGASKFEQGNPGLMLEFLKDISKTDVDYLAHREPKSWPKPRDLPKIPMAEIGGKTCYDARAELAADKPIHLVNLGKGGAAANWGWSRMREVVVEYDYFDHKLVARDERKDTVRFGMGHYKPDLVIVNFGTNDVNGAHPDWLVEDYLFHMKVLATNIQQRFGAAVVLSTPHKWTGGVHLISHRQPAMVDALRAYCKATGVALADVYNEYKAGQYDGIHPRDVGHRHIANAYIKTILGQPSISAIEAQTTADELKDNGDGAVTDTESGLMWTKSADLATGGKTAEEAAAFVAALNAEKKLGHDDWRLPTRDELLKLVDPLERPALPKGHPFTGLGGWYRTSTGGWGVDLDTGIPWSSRKTKAKPARLWLVRGGK